jgi:hypothetical protein
VRQFEIGAIVERIRQQSDTEGSDFVEDPEIKSSLSTGFGELYSLLVESGARYFEARQSIASTDLTEDDDGGAFVPLPADYLSTIGVDRQEGGRWCELEELMVQERNTVFRTGSSRGIWWATIGQNLHLYPVPSTGTYRHIYVPQPPQIHAADDKVKIDVVTPDGEAFLIWYVVAGVMAKEESQTQHAVMHRERALGRIQIWASLRALNNPRRPQVRDPYEDRFRHWGGEYI